MKNNNINKKAQGLSLNTIIIAIIVIIVLVIIILITTGQLQKFTTGLNNQAPDSCIDAGGVCTSSEYCNNIGGTAKTDTDCGKQNSEQVCCVRKT